MVEGTGRGAVCYNRVTTKEICVAKKNGSKNQKAKKRARRAEQRTIATVVGAVGVAALAFFGRRQIGDLAHRAGLNGGGHAPAPTA